MNHKISVLFYSRTSRSSKEKLVPIYMRITVNGHRIADNTTDKFIEPSKWLVGAGKMRGNSEEARTINSFLDSLKNKVYACEREMMLDGKEITPQSFKEKWSGSADRSRMLLEVFQQHNDQLEELIGKEYSPATLERYKTSRDHTRSFLEWKYGISDIDIRKLDYEFVCDYEFWLKSKRHCSHNTALKYISNFRKIVNICIKRGWLQRDPFLGFKMSKREVERDFLTEGELQRLASKSFASERLNQVRDIFLFSCFTGLAYADVKKLKRTEIADGIDGGKWIYTSRQKTDVPSRVPILPITESILEKYKDHAQCIHDNRLLPVLSNQKMNAYLKEIADLCEIPKNLTFHIARHTFATTVTLSNGVPIESVSKMLGHKNIRTTQHYAKILDQKVSEDMRLLKAKLDHGGLNAQLSAKAS